MASPRPLVLTILDGWGYSPETKANAVFLAHKPAFDKLIGEFPNTLIHTSGHYVGLPDGQMGNSEVGHLNIGAGRVVYMDITKVDLLVEKGQLFTNPALLGLMKQASVGQRRLHLFGLLSDGGVHSQQEHLYALLRMAKQNGLERVFVHCWMDGRDTPPDSGAGYLEHLQQIMREYGVGQVATVSGRYYAMDRDRRWERVLKAFNAMVLGKGEAPHWADPVQGIKDSYDRGVTDEFIVPFVCTDAQGAAVGSIRDGDCCLSFNFRADRAREITRAITRNSGLTAQGGRDLPDSDGLDAAIPRDLAPKNLHFLSLTEYDADYTLPFVVPPEELHNILADVMADKGLTNLRVAETEKYAHVTYFFNGGVEKSFSGEERIMVPSPKVATYDLMPEMSSVGDADAVVNAVEKAAFDIIVVNFANADMVGHSGKLGPAIKAIEAVDRGLGRVYEAVRQQHGAMIVTADHGNAETMIDPVTGGPHTYHTLNPVPLIIVSDEGKKFSLRPDGSLRDIAPTMLGMLGIAQPKEMTGSDLRILGRG